jgi:hypothetical protein
MTFYVDGVNVDKFFAEILRDKTIPIMEEIQADLEAGRAPTGSVENAFRDIHAMFQFYVESDSAPTLAIFNKERMRVLLAYAKSSSKIERDELDE